MSSREAAAARSCGRKPAVGRAKECLAAKRQQHVAVVLAFEKMLYEEWEIGVIGQLSETSHGRLAVAASRLRTVWWTKRTDGLRRGLRAAAASPLDAGQINSQGHLCKFRHGDPFSAH